MQEDAFASRLSRWQSPARTHTQCHKHTRTQTHYADAHADAHAHAHTVLTHPWPTPTQTHALLALLLKTGCTLSPDSRTHTHTHKKKKKTQSHTCHTHTHTDTAHARTYGRRQAHSTRVVQCNHGSRNVSHALRASRAIHKQTHMCHTNTNHVMRILHRSHALLHTYHVQHYTPQGPADVLSGVVLAAEPRKSTRPVHACNLGMFRRRCDASPSAERAATGLKSR